jgi:hypothetical protein
VPRGALLSVLATRALLGGAQAPLAEADLQLAAEHEGDDPTTEQQQEFERFGGHQRHLQIVTWSLERNRRRNIVQGRATSKMYVRRGQGGSML